jgi:NDP-sugar pyrophosphorylase family protein
MQAIILAGGKGARLKPFTNAIPKPLVPLGDTPILEIVLRQLKHHHVSRVTMAVNHLAHLIMAFFGDGAKLGLDIDYSIEETPLGTAGPLKLVKGLEDDFLVMNGDLLSTIDYEDLMRVHQAGDADVTIGTYEKHLKIDLGVLTIDGDDLVGYTEKPTYTFDVSMGIYAVAKRVVDLIRPGERLDLPELVLRAKAEGFKVKCYSGDYEWLDIGRVEDYETAVELFNSRRDAYLPDE